MQVPANPGPSGARSLGGVTANGTVARESSSRRGDTLATVAEGAMALAMVGSVIGLVGRLADTRVLSATAGISFAAWLWLFLRRVSQRNRKRIDRCGVGVSLLTAWLWTEAPVWIADRVMRDPPTAGAGYRHRRSRARGSFRGHPHTCGGDPLRMAGLRSYERFERHHLVTILGRVSSLPNPPFSLHPSCPQPPPLSPWKLRRCRGIRSGSEGSVRTAPFRAVLLSVHRAATIALGPVFGEGIEHHEVQRR